MAVYYKWIKGCSPDASLTSGLWTYLSWGVGNEINTTDALPKIEIRKGRQGAGSNCYDMGYVLTNKAPNPEIFNQWNFYNSLQLKSTNSTFVSFFRNKDEHDNQDSDEYVNVADLKTSDRTFILNTSIPFKVFQKTSNKEVLKIGDSIWVGTENLFKQKVFTNLDVYGNFRTHSHINVDGHLNVGGNLQVDKYINAEEYCQAKFFNATSDRRAKENITLAKYSALNLINSLTVYNYNYKDSRETVTGIMAQDLFKLQPKELDLVSNTEATGENGDYMSIKNDKMMYVLLKAIQEQQKEIEELKSKILHLENINK